MWGVVLVALVLLPSGKIESHTRRIEPYGFFTAMQVCEQALDAFMTAPSTMAVPRQRDGNDQAQRRTGKCLHVQFGGTDA